MKTKLCLKCNHSFHQRQEINGKIHNLQHRKFCLTCSPFKKHNTKDITKPLSEYSRINGKHQSYSDWSQERKSRMIKNIQNRRFKRKLELVKELGNKCQICGYNKNLAALEFHHINPKEKKFDLSIRHIASYSWEKIQQELKKCQLLCSNCHAEYHHPQCKLVSPEGLEPTT